MRRGFKTLAQRIALQARDELDVQLDEPLDPYRLAELYGIPVCTIVELDCQTATIQHFSVNSPATFSAALLNTPYGFLVVENKVHAPVRRRSTMAHEMAHVLLEHEFTTHLINQTGKTCRSTDTDQEDEANELAGELLIPSDAARAWARRNTNDREVALRYGVSLEFARWRMNATGARLIAARRAAYQQSARPQ